MKYSPALLVALCLSSPPFALKAEKPSQSHMSSAAEVTELIQVKKQFSEIFNQTIQGMIMPNIPEDMHVQFVKSLQSFTDKVSEDPDLTSGMVAIYADVFSEEELIALANFFKSPVGKKYLEKNPELFERGANLGESVMNKYESDFMEMLQSVLGEDEQEEVEVEITQ